MRCKKCKYLIREHDWEYYVVHRMEAHGVRFSDTIAQLKEEGIEIDQSKIDDIWKMHKETGKKGKDMFIKK